MPRKLLLVDCPNQAFRAYYGIQSDMRSPDGFPTRALFGFTRIMRALVRDHQPDFVACVFDRGADARLALWPAYKGTRPDMPDDLRQQWPELEPLCRAFGYAVLSIEGVEADDIIGTLARQFAAPDLEVQIVSGDKDFCQLVGDSVVLLDVMKGERVDRAGVLARWGVAPEKIVELLALMGDTSDNVPGVPGVGPKKAQQFVEAYGDVEGVIAHAAQIGGKTGQAVAEFADQARLARRLVEIDCAVPTGVGLDDLRPRPPDVDALRERLLRYNFKTLWNELGLGERPGATPSVEAGKPTRVNEVAWGPAALSALVRAATEAGRVALAVEAAEGRIHRLRLAFEPGVFTVPWDRASAAAISPLLSDPAVAKTGYDLKPVVSALAREGIELRGIAGDVLIADYLRDAEQKRTLDHLAKRWLEQPARPGLDVDDAWSLDRVLGPDLAEDRVYREIELPLIPVLAEMERTGILCRAEDLQALSAELGERATRMMAEIHRAAGEEFNPNSPQQVATILYDKLGLQAGKKTKTGRSTDADTLEKLDHPIAAQILAYRELLKLKGTYVDALPKCVGSDGRIHTTFGQAVAATGRLSSNDPNLQNIPVRTEDGRRIRAAFVAPPGYRLLSADYSQIELRVLAHYCAEGPLVESFLAGQDIHRRTASEVFGVALGFVSGEQRRAAKAINFGIVYGMGAFRLAGELGIARAKAQAYIEGYFARYPQVRATMERATARARELGYAETLYGRKRPVRGLDAANQADRAQAERIAINTPIQGTAADLVKLAMIQVHDTLRGTGARLLLQVHDELLLEVPDAEVAEVGARVKRAMEGVATLAVPLVVDVGSGTSWADAH